jgi:hypothetical protein
MKYKLNPWTLNAKQWRIDNEYTTPEWEMYVTNMRNKCMVFIIMVYLIGILLGFLLAITQRIL